MTYTTDEIRELAVKLKFGEPVGPMPVNILIELCDEVERLRAVIEELNRLSNELGAQAIDIFENVKRMNAL